MNKEARHGEEESPHESHPLLHFSLVALSLAGDCLSSFIPCLPHSKRPKGLSALLLSIEELLFSRASLKRGALSETVHPEWASLVHHEDQKQPRHTTVKGAILAKRSDSIPDQDT